MVEFFDLFKLISPFFKSNVNRAKSMLITGSKGKHKPKSTTKSLAAESFFPSANAA